MRCLSRWLLVIGVAALIASPVMAQGGRGQGRGRGGFGGMGGPAGLVNMVPVQKELKLSEDDVTKAKETIKGVTDKYADQMAALRDLPREEQMPKRLEISTKQTEEIYTALAKDWKPEQVKRLKQLGVQQMGLQAFNNPSVDKVLKLTAEQKEKVTALNGEQREEMQNIFQGGGGDQAEMQKKMAAMRKDFTGKAVAMLTDEQKKEWKDLTGESFEFPAMAGGFGRGGKGKRKKDKGSDN